MLLEQIKEYLDENEIRYAIIRHSPAHSAQEVAASAHIPGKAMAKTVMVKLDGVLAMVVVPATCEVDLDRLKNVTGAEVVRLANELDFAPQFPDCQVGAMPAFGRLFGLDLYVERSMAQEDYIAFNAGTHTDVMVMRFADYRRLAHPKLVYIAEAPFELRSHRLHA